MAPIISSRAFLTCLSLLFQYVQARKSCNPPTPLNITYKPDFAACLATVNQIVDTTFIDQAKLNQWNESGCFDGDPTNGVLSLSGCYHICGKTYGIWPWKDTFDRLSLWILPAIILISHLSFPPLCWYNYVFVILRAIGNPIDSLQSLLTRLETHRRLRRVAKSTFSRGLQVSEQVATVFAAYEELGWQDVSEHFKKSYQAKELDEQEIRIIRQASYELSSMRLASMPSTLVAIITLVGTLATAIIRTIRQVELENTRVFNETAHTIAVVCILFVSIPQAWLSSRLGTFTTASSAIIAMNTMNKRLRCVGNKRKIRLFPRLQLTSCPLPTPTCYPRLFPCLLQLSLTDSEEDSTNICRQSWPEMASYLGMNSSWRPCKHMHVDPRGSRPYQLLFFSFVWVAFGACMPAIFLSATNRANTIPVGLGCRSLTWTGILGAWIFSFLCDYVLRWYLYRSSTLPKPTDKLRWLWRCSVVKDGVVTSGIVAAILTVQVGRYNSCWCRASFAPTVTLVPYTTTQWKAAQALWAAIPSCGLVIILGLVLFVEWRGTEPEGSFVSVSSEHGSPLCKSEEQMRKESNLLAWW